MHLGYPDLVAEQHVVKSNHLAAEISHQTDISRNLSATKNHEGHNR